MSSIWLSHLLSFSLSPQPESDSYHKGCAYVGCMCLGTLCRLHRADLTEQEPCGMMRFRLKSCHIWLKNQVTYSVSLLISHHCIHNILNLELAYYSFSFHLINNQVSSNNGYIKPHSDHTFSHCVQRVSPFLLRAAVPLNEKVTRSNGAVTFISV